MVACSDWYFRLCYLRFYLSSVGALSCVYCYFCRVLTASCSSFLGPLLTTSTWVVQSGECDRLKYLERRRWFLLWCYLLTYLFYLVSVLLIHWVLPRFRVERGWTVALRVYLAFFPSLRRCEPWKSIQAIAARERGGRHHRGSGARSTILPCVPFRLPVVAGTCCYGAVRRRDWHATGMHN